MANKGVLKNKGLFLVMALLSVMIIGIVSANSVSFTTNGPYLNSFEVGQTVNGTISISGSSINGISSFTPPNLTFTSNSPDVKNAISTCDAPGYPISPTFTPTPNTVTFSCPVTFETPGSYTANVSYQFNDSTTTSNTVSNTLVFYVNPAPSLTFTPTSGKFDEGQNVIGTATLNGATNSLNPSNIKFTSNPSDLFTVDQNSCVQDTSQISCPIKFNSVSTTTNAKVTVSYVDQYGVTTSNTVTLTVYPFSISAYPTNKNLDIGQNAIINLNIISGSGSYSISNSLLYNGYKVTSNSALSNSSSTKYNFTPTQPGTYNAIFNITDKNTGYSISTSSNWTVYPTPVVSIAVSNAIYDNNFYSTDAGQFLTFHISSTGGTGAPIKVFLNCDPTSLGTLLDCYASNFYNYNVSYGPSAVVLLNATNGFSNTISLQTINSQASDVNITGTFRDTGTAYIATPKRFNLPKINFDTVQTLFGTPMPAASNTVVDQGQFTYIYTTGTGQSGVLPFIWTWFNSYDGSTYSKTLSLLCPTISGSVNSVNTDALTAFCNFQTSTSTPTGKYDFEVNTTDAANFSLFSDPRLVIVNKVLSISASASKSTIDVGQSSLLTNMTNGGTGPYSYQWAEEAPGATTFTNITNATLPTYNFVTNLTTSTGTYNFELFVKDSASTPVTKISTPTSVVVNPDPTVSITPATNTTMDVGQSVTFTATATPGTGSPSTYKYKWYTVSSTSNTFISGATSNTYTYTPTTNTKIKIGVMVTDDASFNSNSINVANITVYPIQTISVQNPSNTLMDVGQSTTLASSVSSGTGKFSYLWTVSPSGSTSPSCPGLTSSNTNTITYTPLSTGLCTIQVAVTDVGTSSYATPKSTVTGTFSPITIYSTPSLSDLTPSNAIIDLGQSETFNVIINGGSSNDMSLALYVSPNNNVLKYVNGAGDGVQTFSNFVPSLSENTFYVNGLDSGVTTPFDIAPSSYAYIKINQAPTSSITTSNSSIHADQESTLSSNISGGTPPFTYQWYIKTPSSSIFKPINNANKPTFLFNISTMTTGGTYYFKLVSTDSASTPFTFNSTNNASVTVNNIFKNNKLVLDVTANITNDPDSGNFGYWALDNLTRKMQVWQVSIPANSEFTYNSYVANISDNGISTTFAGALSPGAGVVEPNNGVAKITGSEDLTFNATFTPGSNTVYTNGNFIAPFNNNGTRSYILLGTYSDQDKSKYSPASTFSHYLDEYFTISTAGINFPTWGDTYTYTIYPPNGQVMTDNSISSPRITGDIITYTVPTVTISQPSAAVLDSGQNETYSVTVYNGIGPFKINLFQNGKIIQSNNTYANSLGNVNGNTLSFMFTPPIGTDTYYISANDTGASGYVFNSVPNTITVYSDPNSITNIITKTNMDVGQSIPVSVSVTGGTGIFSYLWTVAPGTSPTSSCPGFTSSTSDSFVYKPTAPTSNCNFEVTVKDIGVSAGATPITPYTISYASAGPITVYANLTKITLTPLNTKMDIGQSETFTASIMGGTSSSNYVYTWYDNGNVITSCTTNTCVYSPKTPGTKNISVNIRDSGTTTPSAEPPANETASTNVTVYGALGPVIITPINQILDLGQHITFTAAGTGGTGMYSYQWYNNTTGIPKPISGAVSNTLTISANSLSRSTGNTTLSSGNSISYGNYKVEINSITFSPAEVGLSIFYNGMLAKTISVPGDNLIHSSSKLNFSVNGTELEVILSDLKSSTVSSSVNVNLVLPYVFYSSVTDIGTSASTLPIEISKSLYENVFINPKLNFIYSPSNITTDAGFGYSGDVSLNIFNGTPPYSISGINSVIKGLPPQDGILLCSNYTVLSSVSCSFGTYENATPGNYIAYITAIDSSNGMPMENVSNAIHVQINPDINATSTGFIPNVILDPTQQYSYTVNPFGGTPPYEYNWDLNYHVQGHFGSSTSNELNSESPAKFTNITVLNGCGGIYGSGSTISNSICSFTANNATNGSVKLTTTVTDNAMFGGAFAPTFGKILLNSNITIENTPILTITPSNTLLDQNQYETYTVSVTGGAGPFEVNFYNITTGKEKLVDTFTIPSGSSKTITFKATKIGTFSYNATATDSGTTTPFTFNSTTSTISVSKPLSSTSLKVSGYYFDQGQTVDFAANSVSGGTPPYIYKFEATNANTSENLFTCKWGSNQCSFTASQTGLFYGNVLVQDSASTPEFSASTNNAFFIVNNNFDENSRASATVNTTTLSLGNSVMISGNIIGLGGTAPYTYVFTVHNESTGNTIYTATKTNSSFGNSIIYTPTNNGIYYATVNIYDNATPNENINSGESDAFLVGSAATPTVILTPSIKTLDSGQIETFTIQVFDGVGPFNVELYNITGRKQEGSNITIAKNGEGTISFGVNTVIPISLSYNATATDETTGTIFNSTAKKITINPPLGSLLVLSNQTVDVGQSTVLTAQIHGGTPPYKFIYTIKGPSNTIFTGESSNVPASDSSNVLQTTYNSILVPGSYLTTPGVYTVNAFVQDSANGNETLSNTLIINSALQPTTLTINANSFTSGQSIQLSSTVPSTGTYPYTYNFEILNTTTNTLITSSGYQSSNAFTTTATTSMKGGDFAVVLVKDAAGVSVTSNSVIFNVTPQAPTTTTPQNTGGSPGGGGGGSGGGISGGGTPHPTVLNFTNATDVGYEITNFAIPATTSVTEFNATFNLLMNFISPSQVGISINGNPYTLQLTNQSVSIGTIDGNAYYVELSAISYLPLQNTATVYLYTQKPKSPTTNTKPSNKTVNKNVPSNVSTSNKTITKNTTTNTTKTSVTTTPTTTQKNSTSSQNTSGSSNGNNSNNVLLPIAEVIVLVIILGALYYYFFGKKKGKGSKR
ncbi:MAG: hypothetical protein ACP5M9_03310 [Candidatus Micrarchaeia archaeon]